VVLQPGQTLDAATLGQLVTAAGALRDLMNVVLGDHGPLTPDALEMLDEAADTLDGLEAVVLQPGQTLDAATLGQLVTAAGALRDLMNVVLGDHGPLTPDALEMLDEAADTLDGLEAVVLQPGQTLDAATLGALVAAANALDDLKAVVLQPGQTLDAATLGQLVTAAGTLRDLMAVALGVNGPLTPDALRLLDEAADTLTTLKAVVLQPGQTLDAATLTALVVAANALDDLKTVALGTHGALNAVTLADLVSKANEYASLLLVAQEEGVLLTANMLREYIQAYEEAQDDTGREQAAKEYLRARMIAARLSPLDAADPPMRAVHNTLPMFLGGTDREEDNAAINTHVMVASSGSHMIDVDGDPEMDVDMTDVEFARVGTTPGLDTSADSSLATRWTGRVLERALPGGRDDHVVVYSDVRAPWQETFRRAYASLADSVTKPTAVPALVPQGGEGQPDDETDAAFNARKADHDALLVTYNTELATYNSDQKTVASGDFMPMTDNPYLGWNPGDAQYAGNEFMDDDDNARTAAASAVLFWTLVGAADGRQGPYQPNTPADDDAIAGRFSGTFDGVPGRFICAETENECQVRVVDEDEEIGGKYTSTQMWIFVATDGNRSVTTRRKDGDYLTLGWWLEVPNDERGIHQFSPYYAGRDPFATDDIGPLTGSASYAGPAAGKYATRVAGSDTAQKGVFTATASLTADFEDDNMVSGRITDFMDEGGSPLVGNWNVELGGITTADVMEGGSVVSEGDSGAGGRRWETGAWEAQFYGNPTRAADNPHPTSIAGQFDARWGTAEPVRLDPREDIISPADIGFAGVAGVFGAHRVDE
jgi:hypothetical protein